MKKSNLLMDVLLKRESYVVNCEPRMLIEKFNFQYEGQHKNYGGLYGVTSGGP